MFKWGHYNHFLSNLTPSKHKLIEGRICIVVLKIREYNVILETSKKIYAFVKNLREISEIYTLNFKSIL